MTMAVTISTCWKKTENSTMEVKRLHPLALEIFRTLDNLNPKLMEKILYISPHNAHRRHDIFVQSRKTTKYGDKNLTALGPHLWKSLSEKIKSIISIFIFKNFIKTWFRPKCKCKLCSI